MSSHQRTFEESQTLVEQNVYKCCKMDGRCMSEYRRLILTYWTFIDHAMKWDERQQCFYIFQHRVVGLTSPESITRAFRKLVEKKVLQLTLEQQEKRVKMEEEYRLYHSPKNDVKYYTEGMDHWKET
jgi:hypothetical protein